MPSLLGRNSRSGEKTASSSRRQSDTASSGQASSQLDDWSSSFTGLVDLDRQMRHLALAEHQSSEPSLVQPGRKDSASSRQTDSTSSTASSGVSSQPWSSTSSAIGFIGSDGWTSAFTQNSPSLNSSSPSLLAKRRASSNTDAYDNTIRLSPLPMSPFGMAKMPHRPTVRVIEDELLTPRSSAAAAAATWTDSPDSNAIDNDYLSAPEASMSGLTSPYAIRRSAQSLALGIRFKMVKASRKLKRTGKGAVDHLAQTGRERDSSESHLSNSLHCQQ